jgi:hypothetical protein
VRGASRAFAGDINGLAGMCVTQTRDANRSEELVLLCAAKRVIVPFGWSASLQVNDAALLQRRFRVPAYLSDRVDVLRWVFIDFGVISSTRFQALQKDSTSDFADLIPA